MTLMDELQKDETVLLKGVSLKGKNRVRELGARWLVVRVRSKIACIDGDGPFLLVAPVEAADHLMHRGEESGRVAAWGHSRWIAMNGDKDFEVIE